MRQAQIIAPDKVDLDVQERGGNVKLHNTTLQSLFFRLTSLLTCRPYTKNPDLPLSLTLRRILDSYLKQLSLSLTAKMVHLGQVINDSQAKASIVDGIDSLQLGPPGTENEDDFTASVYGSRYAGTDLPRHEMPDNEMPREIAYRMIK